MRLNQLLWLLCCVVSVNTSLADNVDLSTVPDRDSVQLTIYNSEDLTLVRETRTVTFKPGVNPLQFSWAGTLIDPTSVELRFLDHPDQLAVLDTTFPHDKPQMLYWNVQSEWDGAATIEITYFTSGITWSADYVCIANPQETEMSFEGFVRVFNNSGERYDDAQVRLVVGTINLVERIARLAGKAEQDVKELPAEELEVLKKAATRDLYRLGDRKAEEDRRAKKPKEITKEGLSEYFIYTIEGTETIENGWSKRMRSFEGQTAPFKIEYRYRPREYGDQLVRMYLLANDEKSHLGTTPLPDGVVRVFRENGHDGLAYLVTQPIKYVAIGDKIELNLGSDREVVFELIKRRAWRDHLWLQLAGSDKLRRVDNAKVELQEKATIVGWDSHQLYAQRVRNYTQRPIEVEVRRSFDGDAVFRSQLAAKQHDFQTAEFRATVKPGETADLSFELITRQGRNAQQSALAVETAERQ